MNLARLWPSTGVMHKETRRGTVHGASLKFDWAALYNATTFVLDLCGVDTASFAAGARAGLGLDLREDLMAAFGNTCGVLAVMPRHGFIPETTLVFKIRNRAKMDKVLGRLWNACEFNGIKTGKFTVPGNGAKGTYVGLDGAVLFKPAFAIHGDKLVVSTMPLTLKYALKDSGDGAIIDLLPETSKKNPRPLVSWFVDPAPATTELYGDLLKILDSQRGLPIEAADLPSAEFVGRALSRFGVEFSVNPYYLSLDLHSPCGIALPLVVGGLWSSQMGKPQPKLSTN